MARFEIRDAVGNWVNVVDAPSEEDLGDIIEDDWQVTEVPDTEFFEMKLRKGYEDALLEERERLENLPYDYALSNGLDISIGGNREVRADLVQSLAILKSLPNLDPLMTLPIVGDDDGVEFDLTIPQASELSLLMFQRLSTIRAAYRVMKNDWPVTYDMYDAENWP